MSRTPLYRQARAAIKQLIVDRELRPGDPLPSEAELAEELLLVTAPARSTIA